LINAAAKPASKSKIRNIGLVPKRLSSQKPTAKPAKVAATIVKPTDPKTAIKTAGF